MVYKMGDEGWCNVAWATNTAANYPLDALRVVGKRPPIQVGDIVERGGYPWERILEIILSSLP